MSIKITYKRISVVMCTYNGVKYIREQIESIVNQTYPIFELIIQDDSSDDNTVDIIREYEQKYPFVNLYINERNKGINQNFFSAIKRAEGDYIAISDQDDIWELDKLEKQMNSIGSKWLSYGKSIYFSDKNIDESTYVENKNYNVSIERMMYLGVFGGHDMLFQKQLVSKIPDIQFYSNYLLYDHLIQIIAAAYGEITYCPEAVVHFRRTESAATNLSIPDYTHSISNVMLYIKRTWDLYKELSPEVKERMDVLYRLFTQIQEAPYIKDAMTLARYQKGDGVINYLKTTIQCVILRHKLFYNKGGSGIILLLRSIYFPISCCDYFRYKSKNFCKKTGLI